MNLPVHQNPVDTNGNLRPDRTASAPYNFVPLPERVVKVIEGAAQLPSHDTYANEGYPHTGYFVVKLTTKSPLYVRCPFTREEFDLDEQDRDRNGRKVDNQTRYADRIKNTPHFFYTHGPDQPVISGSSLRGMLRNLLEIVSYSKMQWVTDKKLFYRTMDSTSVGRDYVGRMSAGNGANGNGYHPRVGGGFIRNQGRSWQIEKCTVARVEIDEVAKAFGVAGSTWRGSKQNLYTDLGPNGRPKWSYQHKPVWVITEASEQDHQHSNSYLRYLKVTNISNVPSSQAGEREGVLVLTGPIDAQHMAFVFIPDPSPLMIDVPNDPAEEDLNRRLLDRFHDDDQITPWQEGTFSKDHPSCGCRQHDGYLRDGEPVFFLRENSQLVFFGRAQMFRLPYRRRPIDLIPDHLRYPEDIDYADALFGFVRTRKDLDDMRQRGLAVLSQGDKARAYAGHVFFTDATLQEGQTDVWLSRSPITPRILATPKPTTFQHYLTQQEPNERTRLDHYNSPPFHDTTLRGHKLYWHQGDRTVAQIKETDFQWLKSNGEVKDDSTQHTQFKPIKSGVTFTFRVYFENLSDRELGALCWVLHPLGDENKKYYQSLGMGKPLGMGAVKLDATLHLTDRTRRYDSLFDGDKWQTGAQPEQQLSDRPTLTQLAQAFEQHILGELNPQPTCTHLFGLKRIGMLLKMLEWPGFPPDPTLNAHNRVRPNGYPNTRYMVIRLPNNQNEYRNRPVLPDPSRFGQLTGDAVPGNAPQAPPAPNPPGDPPPLLPSDDAARVTARIKQLRGRGNVSQMPEIVKQIDRIADTAARRQCAEALKTWLQQQKLWKDKNHVDAAWRKRLDQLLDQ
jgi:CRISPR-associated protein (TIGR03986 family)